MAHNIVWLARNRIQQHIDISVQDLENKLIEFRNMRGGKKRVLCRKGEYLLNKDYLDEFAQTYHLVRLDNVPLQDKNWISVPKISGILRASLYCVAEYMRKLKDDPCMRDSNGMPLIQFRKTSHGRYVALCLFNSNEAKHKLAEKMGIKTNRFSKKVPYTMQYNWSEKRRFSDSEIHDAIIRIMEKNYDFRSEFQCADALLSELPKSVEQKLLEQNEMVYGD